MQRWKAKLMYELDKFRWWMRANEEKVFIAIGVITTVLLYTTFVGIGK
jgi:hypothetical protein